MTVDPWALAGFGAWLAASAWLVLVAGPWAGGMSAVSAVVVMAAFTVASTLSPLAPPEPTVPVFGTASWGGVVLEAGPALVVFVLPVPDSSRWKDIKPFPAGTISGAFGGALSDGQRAAIAPAKLGTLRAMKPGEATVFGPVTVSGRERGWLVEWAGGKALIGDKLTVADLVETEPDQVIGAVHLDKDDMVGELDRLALVRRATVVLMANLGERPEAAYLWDLGFPVRIEHAAET